MTFNGTKHTQLIGKVVKRQQSPKAIESLLSNITQSFILRENQGISEKSVCFFVSKKTFYEPELELLANSNADQTIEYVQISSIPLTPLGKVDIAKLKFLYSSNQLVSTKTLNTNNQDKYSFYFLGEAQATANYIHLNQLQPPTNSRQNNSDSLIDQDLRDTTESQQEPPLDFLENNLPSSETHTQPCATQDQGPFTLIELLALRAEQIQSPELIFLDELGQIDNTYSCKALLLQVKILAKHLQLTHNDNPYLIIHTRDLSHSLIAFWSAIYSGLIPVITNAWQNSEPSENDLEKFDYVRRQLGDPIIISDQLSIKTLTKLYNEKSKQLNIIDNTLATRTLDIVSTLENSTNNLIALRKITQPKPDDVAFLCLTSGSTGMPKFVELTHKNILARSKGAAHLWENQPSDKTLNWLPFDHIGSISDWHIRGLVCGCTTVYAPTELVLNNPLNWLDTIDHLRITHTWATDSAYKMIINALKSNRDSRFWDLSCVNTLLNAAEPIAESTAKELISQLSDYQLPKNCLMPAFGMAELGSGVTYSRPKENTFKKQITVERASTNKSLLKIVQIGTPGSVAYTSLGPTIPGMGVRAIDKDGNVLPELSIGEIQFKGSSLSNGYFNNQVANQGLFSKDGWLNTGDKGFIYNKELFLTGRSKDTLIINGKNYNPIDFEVIVDNLASVAAGYTAAIQAKKPGQTSESLIVFFCPNNSTLNNNDLKTIIDDIEKAFSKHHQLKPDYILPVAKDDIPKTSIQKIQRSKLVHQVEDGNFEELCEKIDVLTENNRTVRECFTELSWVNDIGEADLKIERHNTILLIREITSEIEALIKAVLQTSQSLLVISEASLLSSLNLVEADSNLALVSLHQENFCDQLSEWLDNNSFTQNIFLDLSLTAKACNLDEDIEAIIADHNTVLNQVNQSQIFAKYVSQYLLIGRSDHIDEITFWSLSSYYLTGIRSLLNQIDLESTTGAEIPQKFYKSIYFKDIDNNCENYWLDALLFELSHCGSADEVRYDQLSSFKTTDTSNKLARQTKKLSAVNLWNQKNTSLPLQQNTWVLVTGGLGAIGFEVCKWLQNHNINLLVTGSKTKSEIHSRENIDIRDRYQHLENNGNFIYQPHKISKAKTFLSAIDRWQQKLGASISGVFHLAGTATADDDLHISNADFKKIWLAKVEGTKAICELQQHDPNLVAVLFSSIMADSRLFGSPAYCAANRYLQELALQQQINAYKTYAIAWSAWKNLGLSHNTSSALLQKLGVEALTSDSGIAVLEAYLRQQPQNILVGVDSNAANFRAQNSEQNHSIHRLLCVHPREASNALGDFERAKTPIKTQINGGLSVDTLNIESLPHMVTAQYSGVNYKQLRDLFVVEQSEAVKPTNEIQHKLHEIWQRILNHSDFGVSDNFYLVGGSSMLSAAVVTAIKQHWKIEINKHDAINATTILQQETLITEKTSPSIYLDTAPVSKSQQLHERKDEVICLQNNTNNTPFFCLCGIGIYAELAQALQNVAPVYAIYLYMEDRALEKDELLNVNIMAKAYVESIKKVQSTGPYRLLGLSFGGVLAYEVANLLISQGDDVELVGVLDFILPENLAAPNFFNDLKFHLKDKSKRVFRNALRLVQHVNKSFQLKPDTVEVHYRRAFEHHKSYLKPWQHPDKLVVFRAKDEPHHKGKSAQICGGWNQLITVSKNIESYLIDGDHLGILRDAGPKQIASLIEDKLARLK